MLDYVEGYSLMYRNAIAFGLDFSGWLLTGTGFLLALFSLIFETSTYPLVQSRVELGATLVMYGFLTVITGVGLLGLGKLFETYANWENNK